MPHYYTPIDYNDYYNVSNSDKLGYYCLNLNDYYFEYRKDNKLHNESGPGRFWSGGMFPGRKEYWLNGKIYAVNDLKEDNYLYIPDDNYWIKWQKLTAFQ